MLATALDPSRLSGPNPFLQRIVRDPWALPPDASAVHDASGRRLCQAVARVAREGRSRLIVLAGESGTGKSHLLGRLRRHFAGEAFFAYVDPYVRTEDALRHVRLRTVESLARRASNGERLPLERFIDEVLALSFRAIAGIDPGPLAEAQAAFERDVRSGAFYVTPERVRLAPWFIRTTLGRAAEDAGEPVVQAFVAARQPQLAARARAWLQGLALDPEDLAALALPPPDTTDAAGRRLVCALAALVRGAGPLVLCFDQTESLPADETGRPDLAGLLRQLGALRDATRNLAIVVTCLGEVWRQGPAEIQPDLRLDLRGLSEAEARALVSSRFEPPNGRAPAQGYPLGDAFYRSLGDRPAAREVLAAAARAFDDARRASDRAGAEAGPRSARPDAAFWAGLVRTYTARAADGPAPTDDILAWSLETLLGWRRAAGRGGPLEEPPRGVQVAWRTHTGVRLGVSFAGGEDGRSVLARLRAATRALEAGEVERLLLVRCGPVLDRWKSAPARLAELGAAGGLLVGLDEQSRAALQLVRQLRLAADADEILGPEGTPLSTAALGWALTKRDALPSVPLLDVLEGTHAA